MAAGAPAVPRRWAWRVREAAATSDGKAVALLVAVTLGLFVVPSLAGQPPISGDDAIQNFPLRVFTGQQLAAGHLPFWNPYLWSGTPLLGGLNAGSAYPFTWLFAFVPAVGAWVLNVLGAYLAAALGCYALLRTYDLLPGPSLLGSLTYAFSGSMTAQLVHLPIVQGWGWMPLVVLCEVRLARALVAPSEAATWPWTWTALLATVLGLVLLTGEPRGMAEAEIVAAVVGIWVLVVSPEGGWCQAPLARRARLFGHLVLAAAWAAALGAVQLLPGWSFISTSQRATESVQFFGSGSLEPAWSVLLLVPNIFGGDAFLHQPQYFNSYNLPEVAGYVGLLPLGAALALGVTALGRRAMSRRGDVGLWLVLLVLGVLLTFGTYTWAGGLFAHIPFFGKTRLQSRNLGIVDLALSVLLAFFLEGAWRRGGHNSGLGDWRRFVAAGPALAAAVLCGVAIALPHALETAFGVAPQLAYLGWFLAPFLAVFLVLSLATAAVLVWWRHLSERAGRVALAALVVAGIVAYNATSSTGLGSGDVEIQPSRAKAVAVFGTAGRFAIFDTTATNIDTLSTISQPDLNVLTRMPSVQGYGSLVASYYGDVTGSHTLDTLDACALGRHEFAQLRLASLIATPSSFVHEVVPGGRVAPPPGRCPGASAPGTPRQRSFYFAQTLALARASLVAKPGGVRTLTAHPPVVGIVTSRGSLAFPPVSVARSARGWWVTFARPVKAAGLVVEGPAQAVSDSSLVSTATGVTYILDGSLQDGLGQAEWRYAGSVDGYGRFVARHLRPPVWLEGPSAGSSVRQLSTSPWGSEVDEVMADRRVLVVRSEANQAGWRASVTALHGGPSVQLTVRQVGLVQGVEVPPGTWRLTFTYRPPRFDAGAALSLGGLAGLGVVGTAGWWRRRGRRKRGRSEPPATQAGTETLSRHEASLVP